MGNTYQIEKDVPVGKKERAKLPMDDLVINDSFLVPKEDLEDGTRNKILAMASYRKIKVTTKMTDEGLRVWRIK